MEDYIACIIPVLFSKNKEKVYLLFENLDQLENLNIGFIPALLLLTEFFFQLIVLLKLNFSCSSSFEWSWVKKVTPGNSVNANVGIWLLRG